MNGYKLEYRPEHPSALSGNAWDGYVYEHILVAERDLGRHVHANEVVHHFDFNRENNRSENLIVLSRSQHTKLHEWLKRIGFEKEECSAPVPSCARCDATLQAKAKRYCSPECSAIGSRRATRPDADELKIMMSKMSMSAIGRMFGVSCNAVKKWAKNYGIA